MDKKFNEDYLKQLPRHHPVTVERVLAATSGIASLAGLLLTIHPPSTIKFEQWLVLSLSVTVALLGLFIFWRETSKSHRYAQSVFYTHYINHVVRDFVATLHRGGKPILKDVLVEIADATATCFSILAGRRCRCSIKELKANQTLVTCARDRNSLIDRSGAAQVPAHPMDKNSDFQDLWYGRNGCYRYFFSNDLKKLFRKQAYENSSFERYGRPKINDFLGIMLVTDWRLPYKSSIIWPIRHIPNHEHWPLRPESSELPPNEEPRTWGFFCVDSNSRNAFDERYAVELGSGIADLIFTLLSVVEEHDKRTSGADVAPKREAEKSKLRLD
jgi:hypothetical protein